MLLRGVVTFAVLLAAASLVHAQSPANIAGTWNGQFAIADHCDNGTIQQPASTGTATASFTQDGTPLSGTINLLSLVLSQDGSDCRMLSPATNTAVAITGTARDGSFVGEGDSGDSSGPHALCGSVSSTLMTFSLPADQTTQGTITLMRAQTPDGSLSGAWSGQYALADHCDNGTTSPTSQGTATASFSQNGTPLSGTINLGSLVLSKDGSDCSMLSPAANAAIAITGTVRDGSFAGVFGSGNCIGAHPISGSVNSTSMTFSFPTNETTQGTITLSRTSSRIDLTGTWSGTAAETVSWSSVSGSCTNGTPAPIHSSGPATLAIAQNGPNFLGAMSFPHDWRDVDPAPQPNLCSLVDSGPVARVVSGVVSGSTIIASTLPLVLSVSGTTITFTFPESPDALEHGSFTLTREASMPVGGTPLTGTWSGTMNESFTWPADHPGSCNGTPAPFTTSLPSTLAIAQNGSSFSGALTIPHRWNDHGDGSGLCEWVDAGTYKVTVSGTVSGSTITGTLTAVNLRGQSVTAPLTLSVSGSTITGSFQADEESASFTLTKQDSLSRRRGVER